LNCGTWMHFFVVDSKACFKVIRFFIWSLLLFLSLVNGDENRKRNVLPPSSG
jgi:hypothetical protein